MCMYVCAHGLDVCREEICVTGGEGRGKKKSHSRGLRLLGAFKISDQLLSRALMPAGTLTSFQLVSQREKKNPLHETNAKHL